MNEFDVKTAIINSVAYDIHYLHISLHYNIGTLVSAEHEYHAHNTTTPTTGTRDVT